MKLKYHFPEFCKLRKNMGAQLSDWTLSPQNSTPLEPIEIILSPDELDEVTPLCGIGPLQYRGKQVVLYIKDTNLDKETVLYYPENSRRFHIFNCNTIQQMFSDKRHKRYVATNRNDGLFLVDTKDYSNKVEEDIEAELFICKHCFRTNDLSDTYGEWPNFSLRKFFRDHETFFPFEPEFTDITAPSSGYPKNWRKISKMAKEKENYTCEECGVDCDKNRETRRFIHCHHIDGVKTNNKPENLQVLCTECHSKQPGHGRYPPTPEEISNLANLRSGN